ncbi:MAG TPA: GNAT family N-acetyltransferase [Candidatus Baltobacteraceae bacterium]|jgi:ribosomal protein S18 acetylase RimI-like enzyme|nr:GNAT family N-acetyltransferase [Candidatus Baltobacteraceae bacterium]
MKIRRLRFGDTAELEKVSACFDHTVRPAAAKRFLESEVHHILVAYEDEAAVGFVTGVETTHPDKGTEMFLYELAVDERFRRRGHGAELVSALAGIARERGCYGMWVGVEEDNVGALATYRATGAASEGRFMMLSWKFAASE